MPDKKLFGHVNPGDVILTTPGEWRTVTNTTHSQTPTGLVRLWWNGQENFISGEYNDEITCVDYNAVRNERFKVKGNVQNRVLDIIDRQISKREHWLENAVKGKDYTGALRHKEQLSVLTQIHQQVKEIK